MNDKNILALVAAAAFLLPILPTSTVTAQPTAEPALTHAQEVWLHALEWCESRGVRAAVNPKDLDGTPSYGAYQFKPSTLDYYAAKYGVATTTTMDYATQRRVVEQMVLHGDEIRWTQQFPACVRKLGPPPKA